MEGHFKISLLNSKGLNDNDFIVAKKNNKVLDLINSLELKENIIHSNLVLQTLPHWFFHSAMGGPRLPSGFEYSVYTTSGLGSICLLSTDTEPDYDIPYTYIYADVHSVSDSVDTSHGGKLFIEDNIANSETNLIFTRESIFLRNKFLYLPNEAISSNIKSIGVYWCSIVDSSTSHNRGLFARIRLKDSDGNNTTIVKTADEVLLVEYTLTFTSV